MTSKSYEKSKGRRERYTFSAKPHCIFRPDLVKGKPSPASALGNMAFRLLDNLFSQFNGRNNGDLSAAPKITALYGWKSQGSVTDALNELLANGFIEQTRQGGRNQCSLFAVTWLAIDECNGKLDRPCTNVASNLWKPENQCKIDRKFVDAWGKARSRRKRER